MTNCVSFGKTREKPDPSSAHTIIVAAMSLYRFKYGTTRRKMFQVDRDLAEKVGSEMVG
jgi:hypothetical protein